MRTLTLTQPWASLVALGAKRVETRSWRTSYRGPLAIHAASSFPEWARQLCETDPFDWNLMRADYPFEDGWRSFNDHGWRCLPTGCIVAVCDLVDIYPTEARILSYTALDLSFDSERGFKFNRTEHFLLPPPEPELSFGDYSPGRFAWRLENVRALREPIPAKGSLGLWEWPAPAEVAAILNVGGQPR